MLQHVVQGNGCCHQGRSAAYVHPRRHHWLHCTCVPGCCSLQCEQHTQICWQASQCICIVSKIQQALFSTSWNSHTQNPKNFWKLCDACSMFWGLSNTFVRWIYTKEIQHADTNNTTLAHVLCPPVYMRLLPPRVLTGGGRWVC